MLFLSIQANAQINLGFETAPYSGTPAGWTSSGVAYAINTPGGFPAGALTKVGQISTLATNNLYQAFTVTSDNTALTIRYWGSPGGGTTLGIFHIKVFKTTAPGTIYYELTSSSFGSGTVTPIDLTACIGSEVKILFEVTGGVNSYWDWDCDCPVEDPTQTLLQVDASFPAGPPAGAPIAYAVTGGGSSCTGTAEVGLANSETGVTYTLSPGATVRTGTTGSAISFGSQPAGTYTASGTSTGGTTPMTGSATVTDIRVTPTFTQLGPYCQNATPGTLPTTSTNSPVAITGTWNAAISTAAAGTIVYTFTPTAGQCAKTATMSILVNANVTPTFTQLGPYGVGTTPGTLPTTSLNSITGSWNAAISTAAAGTITYTFTPNAGPCATTATMSILVVTNETPASQPPFQWAKGIGGAGVVGSAGNCVKTDASGNVYTVGGFNSTDPMDFDPGAGTSFLTSNGSDDIFITKTDASGNFLWARSYGGIYSDKATSIAVDGSGNAYVIGEFTNSVDFGGTAFDVGYGTGMFILKLDASGTLAWAQGIMGKDPNNNDLISGKSVAVDGSGNIYISGLFDAVSMDFNPLPGLANEYLLTSPAQFGSGFIAKYDNSGLFVWAKRLRGTMIEDSYGLALDASANVYTTGYYMGTVNFNPGGSFNLTSVSNSYDIYVLKLTSSGVFVWAKSMGGTGGDKGLSIATDAAGNVYTTGIFTGTGDFDPSASVSNLISNGSNDIFISKLDASGNFVWAKSIGGTGDDQGLSLTTDPNSNVYVAGSFNGSVDFEPGANYYVLSSAGAMDIFVTKFDASGNFGWANRFGSTGDDAGTSICVDFARNILTTGFFRGTVDFDASNATFNLTAHASSDVFTTKTGEFANAWTGANNTSWTNAGNWSQGVPQEGSPVTINSAANQPVISTAVAIYSLTINSGAVVTVNASASLTVSSTLTNNAGNAGLVVKSGGSLIESTTGVAATVERNITTNVYHGFSPSVAGLTANLFHLPGSTGLDVYLYGHNEANNTNSTAGYFEITSLSTPLNTMAGYSVYEDGANATPPVSSWTFVEQGNLNTGTIGTSNNLTRTGTGSFAGFNYVGNPYASFIDWNASSGWTKTTVNGTIYTENGGGWASYISPGPGVNSGSNIIAPGQGFFVQVTSGNANGTLIMNNNVRTQTSTTYLKSSPTNYVKLIATGNGQSDETVIRFDAGATSQFDGQYDAAKLGADDATLPQLYSIADRNLAYNALPQTGLVQLGFTAGVSTVFTIGINAIDGISEISLEDTNTGIFTDLTKNSYSFTAAPGDAEQRFVLHFGALSVNEKESSFANIYSNARTVYIDLKDNVKGDVFVYNISGQMVATLPAASGSKRIILANTGNYIVKVITNQSTMVKKVFVQ